MRKAGAKLQIFHHINQTFYPDLAPFSVDFENVFPVIGAANI